MEKASPDGSARPKSILTGHAGSAEAVAIAPDGTWLATTSGDKTARIWAVDGVPAPPAGVPASAQGPPVSCGR